MQRKQFLKWVEAGLYLGGAALITVFLLIRGESERQAQDAIESFHAAAKARAAEQARTTDAATADEANSLESWVEMPDLEGWAEGRKIAYQQSLEEFSDVPHAILTIGTLGIEVPVYNGTDEPQLNRGVGRIIGTAQVDEIGNLGIAGHRDGFFRPLKDIQLGDKLSLLTHEGEQNYTVSSIVITDPSDVSVLKPTDEKTITLVTCYPFYYVGHAPQRFIVTAKVEHLYASTKRGSI